MMRVQSVETYIVTLPRDTPYLGPLAPGERVNARGYVVRKGNGTIYPTVDRSVVVRVRCDDGSIGWGETYGICAPRATCEIINDLLAPELIGLSPIDVEVVWDILYGLMRVRGCTGGFHVDAIAALDIALWDLKAQAAGQPLWRLLGERRHDRVPAYVSGLPAATLAERIAMAVSMKADGHRCFKIAAAVSHQGIVEEVRALRAALGDDVELAVDLHWKFTADEASALIEQLRPYRLAFVEAPVKPEDGGGLARVRAASSIPVAAGEEWYTVFQARDRFAAQAVDIVQPEMGHCGVTQFMRIAALARDSGVTVAPHATIGIGLFLAASVHASSTLEHLWRHEWQHSVFSRNRALIDTDLEIDLAGYCVPTGPGLGARPGQRFWNHALLVA